MPIKKTLGTKNGIPQFIEVIDEGGELSRSLRQKPGWLQRMKPVLCRLTDVFKLWSDVVPVGSSLTVIVLDEQGEQHTMMLR